LRHIFILLAFSFLCLSGLASDFGLTRAIAEVRQDGSRRFDILPIGTLEIRAVQVKTIGTIRPLMIKLSFQLAKHLDRRASNMAFQISDGHTKTIFTIEDYLAGEEISNLNVDISKHQFIRDADSLQFTLVRLEWNKTQEEKQKEAKDKRRSQFLNNEANETSDREEIKASAGKQKNTLFDEDGVLKRDFQFDTFGEIVSKFHRQPKKSSFESERDFEARRATLVKERVTLKFPLRFNDDFVYIPEARLFRFTFNAFAFSYKLNMVTTGSYTGENAFGAKTRVTAKSGQFREIHIGSSDLVSSDGRSLTDSAGVTSDGVLISADPEQAKGLSKSLGLIYSGRVLDATAEAIRSGATRDIPVDLTYNSQTLHLHGDTASLYIVNLKTGEKLAEYRFISRTKGH